MRGADIGEGSRIGASCSVQRPWRFQAGCHLEVERDVFVKIVSDAARVVVGDDVFIGRGSELDSSLRIELGNNVLIAPGCFITDHTHRFAKAQRIDQQGCDEAEVHIENDVWLGTNCVVLAGVRIGAGAVIGANAVVTRDIPRMAIAVGVPARVIGWRQ